MAAENPAAHKGSYHQLFASVKDKHIKETDAIAAKEMNRYAVTAWEVCLQKKTKELGRAENIGRYQLPDECKNTIWKCLGARCDNAKVKLPTSAEMKARVEKVRAEMTEKVVQKMLEDLNENVDNAGAWGRRYFKDVFEHLVDDCNFDVSAEEILFLGKFPDLPPVVKLLTDLGYLCNGTKNDKDEPCFDVMISGVDFTG